MQNLLWELHLKSTPLGGCGKMKNIVCLLALAAAIAAHGVVLVENGVPKAIVVVPEKMLPAERMALEELNSFLQRASGAKLQSVVESSAPKSGRRILFGRAAKLKDLVRGEGRVVVDGEVVHMAGGDDTGDPKRKLGVATGTLYAVYEFLDRDLGVRFLWPDPKDGVVCREQKTISVSGSYGWKPHFENVRIRRYGQLWARRAARVISTPVNYPGGGSGGHAFESWRKKYAQTNPDFFYMKEDGERDLFSGSMCVANPAFHAEIVRLWSEARKKEPGKVFSINACENDTKGKCKCPMCTAWNDPLADPNDASERYAHFYKALYELAAKEDPSVRVYGYAYSNYINPPRLFTLPSNVFVGFVPSPKFPYDKASREKILGFIDGWKNSGCTLNYRPNLLDGYAMPEDISSDYYTEFQAMRAARMKAIDIDGPNTSYSTQGPYLYVLGRMMVHPDWSLEKLKDEYYSAFGPAASAVRDYWEFWNRYALDNADMFHEVPKKHNPIRHSMFFGFHYAFYAHHLFPRSKLEESMPFLARALSAAKNSPSDARRVRFLISGLEHAILCSDCCAAFQSKAASKNAKLSALKAVRDYRADKLPRYASAVEMFTRPGYCEMLAWPYAKYDPNQIDEMPTSFIYSDANRPKGIPVRRGAVEFRDGAIVFPAGKIQHGTLEIDLPLPGGREIACSFACRSINGGRHRLVVKELEFPRIPPHSSTQLKVRPDAQWTTFRQTFRVKPESTVLHLYFEGKMSAGQAVEYKEMKFELLP